MEKISREADRQVKEAKTKNEVGADNGGKLPLNFSRLTPFISALSHCSRFARFANIHNSSGQACGEGA